MRYILTLVAPREAAALSDALLARVCAAVQAGPPDILSPGEAADLPVAAPPDPANVQAALDGAPVDAIVTSLAGRRKKLLIADMDSTIVTGETLDELADFAGLKPRIAAITARAMNGELDFKAALRERVAMLAGLPVDALERTWKRLRLTPGARELVATMRAHGALTALVSGGFSFFTARVAADCGFDLHRSNVLLDDGATLTGRVAEPILDRDSKLHTLEHLCAERGVAEVRHAGCGGWGERPGHAAGSWAGCGLSCQAVGGCCGTGTGGPCGSAGAAVRAGIPRGGICWGVVPTRVACGLAASPAPPALSAYFALPSRHSVLNQVIRLPVVREMPGIMRQPPLCRPR